MRKAGQTSKGNMRVARRGKGAMMTALFAVLLFALVFTMTLTALSSSNINFANAAAGTQTGRYEATATTISTISTNGTQLIPSLSASKFSVSLESGNNTNAKSVIAKNTDESNSWGVVDKFDSDIAIVYWLEFSFSNAVQSAIQVGASFYAYAASDFDDGVNDENGMAIQWITSSSTTAPHVNWVTTSRSGDGRGWSSTGSSAITGTSAPSPAGWANGNGTYSYGAKSGSYNASYAVPSNAIGARMVFGAIADGAMDGGFYNLSFILYSKPNDTAASSDNNYDLTSALYGDDIKITADESKNFAPSETKKWKSSTNKNEAKHDAQISYEKITSSTTSMSKTVNELGFRSNSSRTYSYSLSGMESGLGIFIGFNDSNEGCQIVLTLIINLNSNVTSVDISFKARLRAEISDATETNASFSLAKGCNFSNATSMSITCNDDSLTSLTANVSGTSSQHYASSDTQNKTISKTGFTNIKNNQLVLKATIQSAKANEDGYAESLLASAFIFGIKVKTYGKYYVQYHPNGGTGSMGITEYGTTTNTQEFVYGTAETMKKNGFSNGTDVFTGWSVEQGGVEAYKNEYSTSNGDISKVPGSLTTIYAVWRDSDFGHLPSGTSGNWGSSTNPYVISTPEQWGNLIAIVNKTRDPVNSVNGNFYDNTISGNQTSYTTFYNCYFAVTSDLILDSATPIGSNNSSSYSDASTKNFRGTIYGCNASTGERELKTLTISMSQDTNSSQPMGLFGYFVGGKIEYLKVAGSIHTIGQYAGGIVGLASDSYTKTISNCESNVNITAYTYDGEFNLDPQNGVGGIVGGVDADTTSLEIKNCIYSGGNTVEIKDQVKDVSYYANIYGGNGVGGILGHVKSGRNTIKVTNCKSSGSIYGYQNVGGIGGRIETTSSTADALTFKNLYNAANIVVTNQTAGGIVGYFYGSSTGTNNVATIQYAYNCGTIKGETSSRDYIGGIVGEARKDTAGSVTLKNCYNEGALSNIATANAGAICGMTTNTTITDCWQFKTSSSNNSPSFTLSGQNGSNNFVKVFAPYGNKTTMPATSSGTVFDSWEKIAENNNAVDAFGLQNLSVSSGYFVSIYNSTTATTTGTLVNPDFIESTLTNGATRSLTIGKIVFKASNAGAKLAVTYRSLAMKSPAAITYGDPALTERTTWVADHNYVDGYGVEFYNNNAWSTTAPTQANPTGYNVCVTVKNNEAIVGFRVTNNAYKINKRTLTFVAKDHNNIALTNGVEKDDYIYNGSHQGLQTFSITNLINNTDQLCSFTGDLTFTFSNGTYTRSTAKTTIDANGTDKASYGVTITLTDKTNYQFDSNGSASIEYNWKINQRELTFSLVWTDNTTSASHIAFSYNGEHQGIRTLTIGAKDLTAMPRNEAAGDIVNVKAGWLSDYTTPIGNVYTFDGAINANGYDITISLKDNDISKNYKLPSKYKYNWNISKLTLRLTPVWTTSVSGTGNKDRVYHYNNDHQGLNTLTVSGVISKENVADMLDVTTSWGNKQYTGTYTFDGAVIASATKYTVTVQLSTTGTTNYILSTTVYEWTISPRNITITRALDHTNNTFTSGKPYTYDGKHLGLKTLTLGNMLEGVNVATVETSWGNKAEYDGTYTFKNAINVGGYSVTISLTDFDNYTLNNGTDPVVYSWTIVPMSFVDNVSFAYFSNSPFEIINKGNTPAFLSKNYFDLNAKVYPAATTTFKQDGPIAIIYYPKGNSEFEKEYQLFVSPYGGYLNLYRGGNGLKFNIDYSFVASVTISGQDPVTKISNEFDDLESALAFLEEQALQEGVVRIVITYEGQGNYSGKIVAQMAVMTHDFGGYVESDWGSAEHPYVIEDALQMVRLSKIVNGEVQHGDSVNSEVNGVTFPGAKATDITYAGAFFKIKEGLTAKLANHNFSSDAANYEDVGFAPIGKESNPFSGAFDGNSQEIELHLGTDTKPLAQNYVGLFGYLDGATIKNLKISGAIYANGDYVGGLAGYATGTTVTGKNELHVAVINNIAAGNYTGGAVGYMDGGVVAHKDGNTDNEDNYVLSFATNLYRPDTSISASLYAVVGANYVGGLFGMLNGTKFDISGGEYTDDVLTASVLGQTYVGGIAGLWVIAVAESPQTVGAAESDTYANFANFKIDPDTGVRVTGAPGSMYVGGIAGRLDGTKANGLTIIPTAMSDQTAVTSFTVEGQGFVGGLFGVLEGSGYKANTPNRAATDTMIVINSAQIKLTVATKGTSPYVIGGLFGYVGGAGVLFNDAYTDADHATLTGTSSATFVGGIAGIIGNNATLESNMQYDSTGAVMGGTLNTVTMSSEYSGTSFVGALAGYVAYSAGTWAAENLRTLGSAASYAVTSAVSGTNFAGGLFGAVGRINYADDWASLGLTSGFFTGIYITATEINNILTKGILNGEEADRNSVRVTNMDGGVPVGRIVVDGATVGNSSSLGALVGGITGYVGAQAVFDLENKAYSEVPDGVSDVAQFENYLNIYLAVKNVYGKQNVGGIAGYASAGAHVFNRVIVEVQGGFLGATSATYVGGMFGYMGGGNIMNSVVAFVGSINHMTAMVHATEYGGGFVGQLAGSAAVNNSFGSGIRYNYGDYQLSATIGGIAGSVIGGASVTNSWAYHIATSGTTYANVSPNQNGKYIVISNDLLDASYFPDTIDLAKSAGIIGDGIVTGVGAHGWLTNNAKDTVQNGWLSFAVKTPADNYQIAFYDASGNNKVTNNTFKELRDLSAGTNRWYVYMRIPVRSSSMMVLSTPIDYRDPYPVTDPDTDDHSAQSYRAPAQDSSRYLIEAKHVLTTDNKNVKSATATIFFKKTNGSTSTDDRVHVGYYSETFTPGNVNSPYLINNKQDWIDFAKAVTTKANAYQNKYVKLMTDLTSTSDVVDLASNAAGGESNGFNGIFDGNGHTIKVKYTGNGNGISLFPYAKDATFKNLTISGTINAASNVTDTGWWKQGSGIAAFVGSVAGAIVFENCINKANITGVQAVGGLIGNYEYSKAFTMIGCVNEGNITSTYGKSEDNFNYDKGTGGIVGCVSANIEITIESCRNKGNITGGHNVGGIIGLNEGALNIYNCANTGNIFATLGNSQLWDNTHEASKLVNNFAYAGGIVGRVGRAGETAGRLSMYASYNTGEIMATGNFAGGLVGAIGSFVTGGNIFGHKNGVYFDNSSPSIIAYCYNAGHVWAGTKMPIDANNKVSGGKYHLVGVCGGIIGVMGEAKVSYCYNVGKITSNGLTGADGHWHSRMGGIVGEAEPAEPNNLSFNYCYNVGELVCEVVNPDLINCARYGAGILGYIDGGSDGKIVKNNSKNNYTLKNSLRYCAYTDETCETLVKPDGTWGATSWRGEANESDDGSATASLNKINYDCMLIGDVLDFLSDFTAYLDSSAPGYVRPTKLFKDSSGSEITRGSVASLIGSGEGANYLATFNDDNNLVTYDDDFLKGTLNGYIYIYGCLPTLAMFAVDTKEGLSMLSVSYGKNESGDFVGAQAGSKQSPYIIKDGVDLLGMSALVNASSGSDHFYTFRDKYIEIAHSDTSGSNNIDNLNVTSINMTTLTNNTSTQGKNRFLYEKSAAGHAKDFPSTAGRTDVGSESYDTWKGENYYYNGTSYTNNAELSNMNFIPLGYLGNDTDSQYLYRFEGSFNGSNASINNLKTSIYHANRAYAGLFGKTQNATISNVTLTGAQIKAYYASTTNGAAYGSVAGGIVAWAGGGTTITNCTVKGCDIYAYSENSNAQNSNNSDKANSYAGGIAGVAFSGTSSGTKLVFSNDIVEISGCTVTDNGSSSSGTRIYGYGSNIGGIVGLAAGKPVAHANAGSTSGDALGTNININDNELSNTVTIASLGNSKHAEANTGIGGIVGVIDGAAIVGLSGNKVGIAGNATNKRIITINGFNKIGGMVGYSLGNTTIGGSSSKVGLCAHVNVINTPSAVYSADTKYGTAAGGVIGYGNDVYFNTITFGGTIEVDSSISDKSVENIGGIIGYMDDGSVFVEGESVTLEGSSHIYISSNASDHTKNKNIGGIVGYCNGATFSGTYNITPNICTSGTKTAELAADNVGGFIGYNAGKTYINANQTAMSSTETSVNILGNIYGVDHVGGFIGYNAGTVGVGLDSVDGAMFDGKLTIAIGNYNSDVAKRKEIQGSTYVGGLIGRNAVNASITIQKGKIYNYANVSGGEGVTEGYIGGVVGGGQGTLETGGSTYVDETTATMSLDMRNYGQVDGKGSNYVGGIIGSISHGKLAGYFSNFGIVQSEGGKFIGGSIGFVGTAGAFVISKIGDTPSGDTQFTNCGNVTGEQYVGGAIGATLGTITGTTEYQVTFSCMKLFIDSKGEIIFGAGGDPVTEESDIPAGKKSGATKLNGTVKGKNYVGGVIGLLAGTVTGGEFVNNATCDIDITGYTEAGSLGGAIGMIGITDKSILHENDKNVTTSISTSQFEYDVKGLATASESGEAQAVESGESGDFIVEGKNGEKANGVGGVIGVITAGAAFDYTNNFFVTGNVTATSSDYVGGAVGFVRADNVELRNILLDHTVVTGNKYVGGIVGGISGTGVKITNCYNLHGSVSAGEGVEPKYQGGIVGGFLTDVIAAATDASSSYWVLDKALQKDANGSDDLTSTYIQNAVDEGIWIAGVDGEATNIGSTSTGWVFVIASDLAIVQSDATVKDGVHTTGFYGDDVKNDYGVIGLHAVGGHNLLTEQLRYWKRIANNYSVAERSKLLKDADGNDTKYTAANEPLTDSFIVYGDEPVNIGWLYAAASSSVPGRYLTISTQSATDENAITGFATRADTAVNVNHATVNAYNVGDYANVAITYKNAVTNGSYDLTYIAINANNRDDRDPSNIRFKNSVGNIAIYYRAANSETDGKADAVDFKSKPYNGQTQLPAITNEIGSEIFRSEFGDGKRITALTAKPGNGTANTYGYFPRLARITDETVDGVKVFDGSINDGVTNNGHDFTDAGIYEGYLDIYLFDETGKAKVVGSVPFVYQITPAEVSIKYEENSNSSGYYNGAAKSTAFKFAVTIGTDVSDFKKYLGNDNEIFGDYVRQFELYFMYHAESSEDRYIALKENDQEAGNYLFAPSDLTTGLNLLFKLTDADMLITMNAGYPFTLGNMRNVGYYEFYSNSQNRSYTYNFVDGTWVKDESDFNIMTEDGNYVFVGAKEGPEGTGNSTIIEDGVYSDGKEYPIYHVQKNVFTIEYQTGSATYDTRYHGYLGAKLTAKVDLVSDMDALNAVYKELFNLTFSTDSMSEVKNKNLQRANDASDHATSDDISGTGYIEYQNDGKTMLVIFVVGVNAGTYKTTFDSDSLVTPNFAIEIKEGQQSSLFRIDKRQVNVEFTPDDKEYTYNGKQQGASVKISGFMPKDMNTKSDFNLSNGSSRLNFSVQLDNGDYKDTPVIEGTGVTYSLDDKSSIDVKTYTATVTFKSNSNYTLTQGSTSETKVTFKWTIKEYDLNITASAGTGTTYYDGTAHLLTLEMTHGGKKLESSKVKYNSNGTYTITPFDDPNDVQITITPTDSMYAVNVGTYELAINNYEIGYSNTHDSNFSITASGGGRLEIQAAPVTLSWSDQRTFTYNRSQHGLGLKAPEFGPEVSDKFTNITVKNTTPKLDGGRYYIEITFNNAAGKQESFKVELTGDPLKVDAGTYKVQCAKNVSVTGENESSSGTNAGNYAFLLPSEETYNINRKKLDGFSINGGENTKAYDNSTTVRTLGTVQFNTLISGDTAQLNRDYTLTARYDNLNVTGTPNGATKIIYTLSIKSDAPVLKNYTLSQTTCEVSATITTRQLTLTLRLKNNKATKIYDGNADFGGGGVTSGPGTGAFNSARNIVGNGFSVSNFAESGIKVTAVFRETGVGRSDFDAFVNNLGLREGQTSGKQLVFTVNSANYTIALASSQSAFGGTGSVVDGKYVYTTKAGNIEITPKPITADYSNTAQSYVNPDNTYNTVWNAVHGTLKNLVSGDSSYVDVEVHNEWLDHANKGEYHQHTVIRGNNSLLGATLVKAESATGVHEYTVGNYRLTNQPTLVIGYFINTEEFEIGSLASLLIASYYYSISGDNTFVPVVPTMEPVTVCSESEYNNNTDNGKWSQFEGCSSWDEYFEYLASERGQNVVLVDGNYVYYEEVPGEAPKYTSFKLIKDISGVFTQADLTILENMFHKVEYGADGMPINTAYNWGYGQATSAGVTQVVLQNVIKGGVGDTVTILNSLFGEFTGSFNGNGYVINGFNIMAGALGGKDNAGLFATIGEGATVKDLHLRNVNVVASGVTNVGALAGMVSADITNVSVQGMFNVTDGTNVGGVVGNLTTSLSQVIAMGTLNANGATNVGGIAGASTGTITSAVSMMYIWATGATTVGGIVGSGTATGNYYLENSVWNGGKVVSDADSEKSYDELYGGSVSGYVAGKEYYLSSSIESKGAYDVLDDVTTENMVYDEKAPNPRQSMRLRDIIDVYLLQYSISEDTVTTDKEYKIYKKSASSWLVGNADGTTSNPIIIANQQGVPLLRELRFAAFKLMADVYMYSTYNLETYQGAFFGTVTANGYAIYIKDYDGNTPMFEAMPAGAQAIPLKKY